MADKKDITIEQGKTLALVVRWETEPIVRVPITAISLATGAPRITAASHAMPDGWRGAIYGVRGMKQINARNTPPRSGDYVPVTAVNANTLELNAVVPTDDQSNLWPAYTSGGFIQYYTPVDLAGYTARMDIKDRVGGTELFSLTTENGRIVLDNINATITLTVSATDTEAMTWRKGVYDLELVSGTGVVTAVLTGTVTVAREVTTA